MESSKLPLEGKVAIITGASRGIGKAIATCFNEQGARLVLTARKDLKSLEDDFKSARIKKLDLSDRKTIDDLVTGTIKEFGRIDILVNNAGVFKQSEFEEITEEELDSMMDVDFKGHFLLSQKVFSHMKIQKSGKIIFIASGAGKLGSSKAPHYAAAKSGIISLVKSLAKLGGPWGINVNAVAPGFIETDMINSLLVEKKDFIESLIPLKRIGSPKDVSAAVLFLAQGVSDYITGQTICVDGGHCMI